MTRERKKRRLVAKELRLILHTKHSASAHTIRKGAYLHAARITVKGQVIRACNGQFVSLLDHYYFPFLRFIYDCAPMCQACVSVLEGEGFPPPSSNTGVNSENGGTQGDA